MKTPKVKKIKYRVKVAAYVYVWAQNEDEACDKASDAIYESDSKDLDWDFENVEETDEYYEDEFIPDDVEREDF